VPAAFENLRRRVRVDALRTGQRPNRDVLVLAAPDELRRPLPTREACVERGEVEKRLERVAVDARKSPSHFGILREPEHLGMHGLVEHAWVVNGGLEGATHEALRGPNAPEERGDGATPDHADEQFGRPEEAGRVDQTKGAEPGWVTPGVFRGDEAAQRMSGQGEMV